MNKSKIWLFSTLLVVILCAFVFVGYICVTAKGIYEQGIHKLDEHKWIQSKKYFLKYLNNIVEQDHRFIK